jgi:hypothetical protein
MVLGKVFDPVWEKVTVGWKKLQYEQLRDLRPSPRIVRMEK